MSLNFQKLRKLDADLKQRLQEKLRVYWTHHSTALEGNSLSLGETQQILAEGLTISGKPIKDHNEVMGHARAIDLVENFLQKKSSLTELELFDFHRAIQTQVATDVYAPVGRWKVEPNSTLVTIDGEVKANDTYALPEDVPELMEKWFDDFNQTLAVDEVSLDNLIQSYAKIHLSFVRIHPFADGNGRLARLLANFPLLKNGFPPLIISQSYRLRYLQCLAQWQLEIGRPHPDEALVSENQFSVHFVELITESWQETLEIVQEIQALQEKRDQEKKK